MTTAIYPPHIAEDLVKIWLSGKQPKYPDFLKKLYNLVTPDMKTKNISLYECPDDKLVEALTAIGKRYWHYRALKGYEYKVEILADAAEAVKDMGFQ